MSDGAHFVGNDDVYQGLSKPEAVRENIPNPTPPQQKPAKATDDESHLSNARANSSPYED